MRERKSRPRRKDTGADGEEERLVTELVQKIKNIELPPHQLRALGFDKDWNKKVSPEFLEHAVRVAVKRKDVLRELSKK